GHAQLSIFGTFARQFWPISWPSMSKFPAPGPCWTGRDLPRSTAEPAHDPPQCCGFKSVYCQRPHQDKRMNVQINPLQTPPVRDDQMVDEPGRGRSLVIGGVALVLALGAFWYFTHGSKPPVRRAGAAPVHVATVETGNMAV